MSARRRREPRTSAGRWDRIQACSGTSYSTSSSGFSSSSSLSLGTAVGKKRGEEAREEQGREWRGSYTRGFGRCGGCGAQSIYQSINQLITTTSSKNRRERAAPSSELYAELQKLTELALVRIVAQVEGEVDHGRAELGLCLGREEQRRAVDGRRQRPGPNLTLGGSGGV